MKPLLFVYPTCILQILVFKSEDYDSLNGLDFTKHVDGSHDPRLLDFENDTDGSNSEKNEEFG